MERNSFLINKKIYEYMASSILMTLAMELGDTVDSILVGNLLGLNQMAAIQICTPVLFITQFPAMILGGGGAALAGVSLGKREIKKSSQIFTLASFAALVISVLIAAASFFVSEPLGRLLTTDAQMANYVSQYLFIFLLGTPIISTALEMTSFMTVDNNPKLVSMLFVTANVVNLLLDFILLKYTSWGMYASALSTIIGYGLGLVFVLLYMKADSRMLQLTRIEKGAFGQVKDILLAGAPGAFVVLLLALKNLVINTVVLKRLGNESMIIYTVCANAISLVEMFTGGIIGVMNGLNGILYGEKDYYGVRVLVKRILKLSFIVSALMLAVFAIVPGAIASLFGVRDHSLLMVARPALRLFALSFPFYVFNKFLITYYQSTVRPFVADVVTVLQGFIIIIAMSLLGIYTIGIYGLSLASALSEIMTIAVIYLLIKQLQKKNKLEGNDFYSLPGKSEAVVYDVSIKNKESEAVKVSQQLIDFCISNQISMSTANVIGIAAEELCVNICRYGYNKDKLNYIDVNLSVQDGILLLRLRDDGVAFNPIEYKEEEKEIYQISGITLVKNLTRSMNYMRVMNMNTTVIEWSI